MPEVKPLERVPARKTKANNRSPNRHSTRTNAPAMTLTSTQIKDFRRDGFLHLPGGVPAEMISHAVRTINFKVGQGMPADAMSQWRQQSFFPELQTQPVITDLFNASGLRENLQQLMGQDNVAPAKAAQLALRFPREPDATIHPPHAHIDGVHTPGNGVPKGTIGSFSALVGIFLSDVAANDAGNFTVWPGSHLRMQNYFREHGISVIIDEGRTPPIEKGEPLQIKAKAGDAVLAHYQLLHGVAGNHAPWPRYATFFRIKHPDHESHKMECLTDLWREWPGVREAD